MLEAKVRRVVARVIGTEYKMLGHSVMVKQVPYVHVAYLAASSMAYGGKSLALSIALLTVAVAALVGVIGTGICRIMSLRGEPAERKRWNVVVIFFLALLAFSAVAFFVVEITRF